MSRLIPKSIHCLSTWSLRLLMLAAIVPATFAAAQESGTPGTAAPAPAPGIALLPLPAPEWPTRAQLAEALASPALREETLLSLAALLTVRDMPRPRTAQEAELQASTLRSHRDWLTNLKNRYADVTPRSPVTDPAAWQVQIQLERVGLTTSAMASPLGPGQGVLARQVFNRSDAALAAATLPELLWYLEVRGTLVWESLRRRLNNDPQFGSAVYAANADWFRWPDAAPLETIEPAGESAADPVPAGNDDGALTEADPADRLLEDAMASVAVMLEAAASAGPPDSDRLSGLRRSLLLAMPELDFGRRSIAAHLLHLGNIVDGLYEGHYYQFAESLVAIVAQLEQDAGVHPQQVQGFANWLSSVLPDFSASYGRAVAAVDPLLNSVIASTYDAAQSLAGPLPDGDGKNLRGKLADAVARLALLVPDIGFYFDQPVRDPIAGGVDACTGIAGQKDEDGRPAMTRALFDDCQETLVKLADEEAREAQLSGDPDGPFEPSQLQRELRLTSGQRINYGIGYLHDRYATGCEMPARPLPNPLEWAYLATFMVWFAEQSPVYFQSPENEEQLLRMIGIGNEVLTVVTEQVDCFAGAGATLNDPVERVTGDYEQNLRSLSEGLRNISIEFRERYLQPGSDIDLASDATQETNYRQSDLLIEPCDATRVCEMTGSLSSTRAMTGLFDDVFLVADQAGLGERSICYDNLGWVERRMEPVRKGDSNVANYFGRLQFELKGRYSDADNDVDLFSFRFTSPGEHHYMFSAASEEILEDACPVEWFGTRIVTELPEEKRSIVPNRLTYLSAPRMLPSRLFAMNWEQNEEWRDSVVSGFAVEPLGVPAPPDISAALNQQLQALYRLQQSASYGSLMATQRNNTTSELTPLTRELLGLGASKLMIQAQMMLFYPHILVHSDPLREAIAGNDGLLDRRIINQYRQQSLPVDIAIQSGYERLNTFREHWNALPETIRRSGSVADSVAHAMVRLNAIYEQYFSTTVSPVQPLISTPLPGTEREKNEIGNAESNL